MQISERRKKVLERIYEKGPLSYEEILNETSKCGDPVEILNDLDTLIFFKFLRKAKSNKKSVFTPKTVLELLPETMMQMKDNPLRIDSRLKKLEHDFPPWYKKLAILTAFDDRKMRIEDLKNKLSDLYPHVRWHPSQVKASLRIMENHNLVSRDRKDPEYYTLTPKGRELLLEHPIQKFIHLRMLKNELTTEFRAFVILDLVRTYNETSGISSGRIIRYLQSEYGLRGNKRKSILNTLNSMVFAGLLVSGRHVYHLGKTVKSSSMRPGREIETIGYFAVQDFKGTVEQFLLKYPIPTIKEDIKSSLRQILSDLEQCKKDLSLRSPEEWADHIVVLSGCLRELRADTWEKGAFRCIIACILSQLLPSEISIGILLDHPSPFPSSEEHYPYHNAISREYYFNLTKACLALGEIRKAYKSFDSLELLSWESFEFLTLKGIIETKKGNAREALNIFEKALKISRGEEKIIALFHIGLANYQRGDFIGAGKAWENCLESERNVDRRTIVLHNLANVYRQSGNLEKAKKLYEDSISFAEMLTDMDEFKVKSEIGLANTLVDLCSWGEAERKLREVIQECTKKGFFLVSALALTNLGVLLSRKGKYGEAFECHEKALELVDRESSPQEYGIILLNVGNSLRQMGNVDEALIILREAFELISNENMILFQAAEIALADLYVDLGNLDKGWELTHLVLQQRWLDNHRTEAEARRIQGRILLRKKEFKTAKERLRESEKIFIWYHLQFELIDVFQLLEECHMALGDREQATHYKGKRENLVRMIDQPP
jgi:tetratricopeptide (TPR) repeat protein/DNA-binding PadR family transcriptional regulator